MTFIGVLGFVVLFTRRLGRPGLTDKLDNITFIIIIVWHTEAVDRLAFLVGIVVRLWLRITVCCVRTTLIVQGNRSDIPIVEPLASAANPKRRKRFCGMSARATHEEDKKRTSATHNISPESQNITTVDRNILIERNLSPIHPGTMHGATVTDKSSLKTSVHSYPPEIYR